MYINMYVYMVGRLIYIPMVMVHRGCKSAHSAAICVLASATGTCPVSLGAGHFKIHVLDFLPAAVPENKSMLSIRCHTAALTNIGRHPSHLTWCDRTCVWTCTQYVGVQDIINACE